MPVLTQSPALTYPSPRKGDVVDSYHGTKVADPYRWMEDLNAPEVKQWIEAENAITFKYLDGLPVRDALKTRISELWNYPKVSVPFYEGRHWFYNRNKGLEKQSVVFTRESLTGPETVVIDPNTLWPDGAIQLSSWVPSPNAQHLAYGQSEGGSDWSTVRVRELASGKELSDVIRWVKFSSLSWTKDGKGFFYGRYPEPPAGKTLEAAVKDKKIYYHRLGTAQSADRLIYDRKEEPTLFLDAEVDESGRYLWIYTNKGTSPKNELFVKDLSDPLSPRFDAPVRALFPNHTAAYNPLGVVNGTVYLLTDRDAPNKKVVAAPVDRPDVANWKVVVPETKNSIESASMVAGKAVRQRARPMWRARSGVFNLDGSSAGRITPPSLGTITGPFGRFDRPEVFYSFTSPLVSDDGVPVRRRVGKSTAFEPPKSTFDASLYETERVFANLEGRHEGPGLHHAQEGPGKRRQQSDDALRIRRLRHFRGAAFPSGRSGVSGERRRLRDGQHARRRRIRRGLARSRHVREETERLR
jgi:prolyl oligopeptidase